VRLWVKDGMIVFWCFEALDSLLGYDDQFKLQYATGESYLNWEKAGFDPENVKRKYLYPSPPSFLSAVFMAEWQIGGMF